MVCADTVAKAGTILKKDYVVVARHPDPSWDDAFGKAKALLKTFELRWDGYEWYGQVSVEIAQYISEHRDLFPGWIITIARIGQVTVPTAVLPSTKPLDKNDTSLIAVMEVIHNTFTLKQLATHLSNFGYVSATGEKLTASHMSSFSRAIGLRKHKYHNKSK